MRAAVNGGNLFLLRRLYVYCVEAGLSSYAVGHRFTRELQVTGLLLRVKFTTDAMLHPVSRNGSHTLRSLLLVG